MYTLRVLQVPLVEKESHPPKNDLEDAAQRHFEGVGGAIFSLGRSDKEDEEDEDDVDDQDDENDVDFLDGGE